LCSKCWKHTVWCDKAVYPPYDDGHLDQFFFIYDYFQDSVVKYTIRGKQNDPGWKYTIVTASMRSRLKEYDPGWKHTIVIESIRSWLKVDDPQRFWFFIQKTETIRSLGRKIYDHKVLIALWWPIIKSLWSYSFSWMVVEFQNLRILYFPQNDRILSVFES